MILVVGASGLLGVALRKCTSETVLGTYNRISFPGGIKFDVNTDSFELLLKSLPEAPDAVILSYGVTNIDACLLNRSQAEYINVVSTCRILDILKPKKIFSVYISSDMVFDGSRGGWKDKDRTCPLNQYGIQKSAVEKYMMGQISAGLIIRLPKLISTAGSNKCFVNSWFFKILNSENITCAVDQMFSPISYEDAAKGIMTIIANYNKNGIIHMCSDESISRLNLLHTLIDGMDVKFSKIVECRLNDLNFVERRPVNTSMTPSKIIEDLGIHFKSPRQVVGTIVKLNKQM